MTMATYSIMSSSDDISKCMRSATECLEIIMKLVLSLCDRTGIMVQPWADAGRAVFLSNEKRSVNM